MGAPESDDSGTWRAASGSRPGDLVEGVVGYVVQQRLAAAAADAGEVHLVYVPADEPVHDEPDAQPVGGRRGRDDPLVGLLDLRAAVRGVEVVGERLDRVAGGVGGRLDVRRGGG